MTRADGSFGISLRPNISGIVLPIPQYAFFEQAVFHDLFRQSPL